MTPQQLVAKAARLGERAREAKRAEVALRRQARQAPRYRPRRRKLQAAPLKKYALCRRCGGVWGPFDWESERGDRGIPMVIHDDDPPGCTSPDYNVGTFIEAALRRLR